MTKRGAQKKTAGKSAAPQTPRKIPQPHGGALLTGGVPGNPGGGRPPSVIRAVLRESFAERIPTLQEIADSAEVDTADRLKAVDLMGKYGLGTTKELTVEHVRDRLARTLAIIRSFLPAEQSEALIRELEPVWRT